MGTCINYGKKVSDFANTCLYCDFNLTQVTLRIEEGKIVDSLDAFRNQTDEYMEMLVKALAKISSKYISYGDSFHVERTFQCEFYHQWSLLLENNPDELCLNGEPCKNIDGNLKYPDLVLHHYKKIIKIIELLVKLNDANGADPE